MNSLKVVELYQYGLSYSNVIVKLYILYTQNTSPKLEIEIILGDNILATWDEESGVNIQSDINNVNLLSYVSLLIRKLSTQEFDVLDNARLNKITNLFSDIDLQVTSTLNDST